MFGNEYSFIYRDKGESLRKMSNSTRIAKNTIALYFRQILIMLVSLYTVRVVLNTLGAEDYGIYNVVAGVVTMFGFLSGAMATASQRYFSFDLGKGDTEHLKTTFSVTFQIYILIALVVVLLAETVGLWFVNHKLVIPTEWMTAANCRFCRVPAVFIYLTPDSAVTIIRMLNLDFLDFHKQIEIFFIIPELGS